MSFASLFGTAASAADDSLQEWRELFLQQDELDESRRQFDEQLEFSQEEGQRNRAHNFALEQRSHQNRLEVQELTQRFQVNQNKVEFRQDLDRDQTRREHDLSLQELRNDHSLELFDREAAEAVYGRTIDLVREGLYQTEEIIALADEFSAESDLGAKYGMILQGMARQNFFDNPNEAMTYLNTILQATGDANSTLVPSVTLFEAAMKVMTSTMTEEEAEAEWARWTPILDAATAGQELATERDRQEAEIALNQASANLTSTTTDTEETKLGMQVTQFQLDNLLPAQISQMQAGTRQIEAGINEIHSNILRNIADTERIGADIRGMDARTDLTVAERLNLEIRTSALPAQLAFGIAEMGLTNAAIQAGTEGQRLDNELVSSTMEAMVDRAFLGVDLSRVELGLAKSEFRVSTATELARITLLNGNVEEQEAAIDLVRQQIAESKENVVQMGIDGTLTQTQVDSYQQGMRFAAVDVLSEAKRNGDMELMRSVGVDLLTEAGIENPEDVIDDWISATRTSNNLREDRELLAARLELAQVREAEFIVANQPGELLRSIAQQEIDNAFEDRKIRVNEEYNRIQAQNVNGGGGVSSAFISDVDAWHDIGFGESGGRMFFDTVAEIDTLLSEAGLLDAQVDMETLTIHAADQFANMAGLAQRFVVAKTGLQPAQLSLEQLASVLPAPVGDPQNPYFHALIQRWGIGVKEEPPVNSPAGLAEMVREGENLTIEEVAHMQWDLMDEEERSEYQNELGLDSVAVLIEDIQEEEAMSQAADAEYESDLRTIAHVGQTTYGISPGADGTFDLLERQELMGIAIEHDIRMDHAIVELQALMEEDPLFTRLDEVPRILSRAGLPAEWAIGSETRTYLQDMQHRQDQNSSFLDSLVRVNQR
jgi:hypothetical protein